ncbi:MAG: hypothetical protein C4344_01920 [Acidimicrobiia bacterium]
MELKRKLALVLAAAATTGLGVGVAVARSDNGQSKTANISAVRDEATVPSTAADQPAGTDADMLQQGDQTTPDKELDREHEAEAEESGTEDPGDANLPGGGHADPPGNVDHQFEGRE